MADFSAQFILYGPDGVRSQNLLGKVYTGASFTVIPETALDELGIARSESATFSLADGSIQALDIGNATLELQGYTEIVTVAFGSDSRKTLIGAESLEVLRLAVDPVYERLLPVDRIVLLDNEDTP